jgi:hypothetical protein
MKASGAPGTCFWRSGFYRPVKMLLLALFLCLATAVAGWGQSDQSREDFTTPTPQKLQKTTLPTAKIPSSTADTATSAKTPSTGAAQSTGAGSGGTTTASPSSGTPQPGSRGSSPWQPIIDNVRQGIDAAIKGGSVKPPDRPAPAAGDPVKPSERAAIPGGKWIPQVRVPDVRGKSRAEADAALAAKGLSMQLTEGYNDSPRGKVFHQEPGPNQLTDQGTGVAVKVSRGPRPVAVATEEEQKPAARGTGRGVEKDKARQHVAQESRPQATPPGFSIRIPFTGVTMRLGWNWLAGAAAAFLIGVLYLVRRRLKIFSNFIQSKLFPPKLRLGASHQGVILEIAFPEGDLPDWEVGVRPVLDRGTQEIAEGGETWILPTRP